MTTQALTLVWLRRDLRTFDHTALQTAIRQGRPLAAVFLFDSDILAPLPAHDRRLSFIHQCLSELHRKLAELKIPLYFRHGQADIEIPALAAEIKARLQKQGLEAPAQHTPEALAAYAQAEANKWRAVIKASGAKAD